MGNDMIPGLFPMGFCREVDKTSQLDRRAKAAGRRFYCHGMWMRRLAAFDMSVSPRLVRDGNFHSVFGGQHQDLLRSQHSVQARKRRDAASTFAASGCGVSPHSLCKKRSIVMTARDKASIEPDIANIIGKLGDRIIEPVQRAGFAASAVRTVKPNRLTDLTRPVRFRTKWIYGSESACPNRAFRSESIGGIDILQMVSLPATAA